MTVKEKLLELLDKNKGQFISGENAAEMLNCTRGAIWKAVKSLRDDGYSINAVTNKGYCLSENTDVLSSEGVRKYLSGNAAEFDLRVYKVLESTNNTLRECANAGEAEGTVVISGEQTKGKGRLGRAFFSPSDTGLYMSILLRPEMTASDAIKITTAAAVSVAEAIEKVSGINPDIKWVNDVYINSKKVCGILTEASFSMENGGLEYAVLGIGVNAYEPEGGFPEAIKDIAGAVFQKRENDMRNKLAAEILNSFSNYYKTLEQGRYYESYRSRLMWKGERINIIRVDKKTPAVMLDVDKDCRLKVRYDDGSEDYISTGEISIRKI